MATILHRRYFFRLLDSTRRGYTTQTAAALNETVGPPYNILFCGTDEFAKTSLVALYEAKHLWKSISVLTARDVANTPEERRMVRASPVKNWAKEVGLEHDIVPMGGLSAWKLPEPFPNLNSNHLLLTASFGKLIPKSMLETFPPSQCLNLHPSLLPLLAGAAPIQWAISRQFEKTGITVQTLGEKFDSGDVYAQEEVPIPPASTYESLTPILAKEGARVLLKVLENLPEAAKNSRPQIKPKDDTFAYLSAPKLKEIYSRVDWVRQTASEIEARQRGHGYLYPIRSILAGSGRVIFRGEVEVLKDISSLSLPESFKTQRQEGTAAYCRETRSMIIACQFGKSFISVKELQAEGKRTMSADKWIIGYRDQEREHGLLRFM